MEILVQNRVIETLDIADIVFKETTREVGFDIIMRNNTKHSFIQRIPYETYNHEYKGYWQPWLDLFKKVNEHWESDKTKIPQFKL